MFEKIEVYPYQRVNENVLSSKNSARKGQKLFKKLSFKNINWRQGVLDIVSLNNILLALGAFIMARALVLEEILPFIFAYLVAFTRQDKKKVVIVGVLALLGFYSLLDGFSLLSNAITLLLLVGILIYIEIPAKQKWWGLPLITLGVIIIVKTIMAFFTGINLYQQMVIVFEAMIAGVLTFVFMVGNDVLENKTPLVNFTFEDLAAFIILGIGIVMGFNEIHLGGLSLSSIICRVGILVAAFLWGSGGGTMVGVMAGIIPSISSNLFAPTLGMYAISGLLAGLFRHFGRLGVIIGFMLGSLALSLFIPETKLTILGMWETGIACLLFFILPSSLKENIPVRTLGAINDREKQDMHSLGAKVQETTRNRIENLAAVFDELSATFVAGKPMTVAKGQTAYLNYLYEEISYNFCESCSHYQSCWGKDCYSTSQEILDLFTMAEANGILIYEDCPVEFRRRCINGREMVNSINNLFDKLRLNEYWSDKLNDTKDLVAIQLKGVSEVIKDLAQDIDVATTVDFELRERLLGACRQMGLDNIIDISPVRSGKEQYYINVRAVSCGEGKECETNLAEIFSSIMKERLEVCTHQCPRFRGKGPCEFTLTRAFTYKVHSGAVQIGKEKICGDSFTIATLKEGKELVALSDGMGSGEEAMSESQTAVRLLESLLSSGFTREIALKTINSILMLRSQKDMFATLDMMIFDLYTGEVDFIKIGSAPSFIKRGNQVGVVTSNSLPIGIINDVEVNTEKSFLLPRDMMVMVSDGVLEIFRGEKETGLWVADFLANLNESDPQVVAEAVLNKALSMSEGIPADDMTVLCSYIDLN